MTLKSAWPLNSSLPFELEFTDGDYSYIVKVSLDKVGSPLAPREEVTVTLRREWQGESEEHAGYLEVRRVE